MPNKILVFGLNYDQIPYVNNLISRGLFVVGCDLNPEAPGKDLVNEFICLGYHEWDKVQAYINSKNIQDIKYVFTAAAQFAHLACAHIAKNLNIAYPDPSLIEIILDKSKFYPWFSENNIPIPKTDFVSNKTQLIKVFEKASKATRYFVKSDYSKNPRYVYSGLPDQLLEQEMVWSRDKFFRNVYVVQPAIDGKSLRINMGPDLIYIFDFETGKNITEISRELTKVIEILSHFLKTNNLERWLIKFDIILNGKEFWLLDIGIDPPSRMLALFQNKNNNFCKLYVDIYLAAMND